MIYLKRSVATPSESLIRPKTDNDVNLISFCKRNSPLFRRPIHLKVLKRHWGFATVERLNFALIPTSIPSTEIVAKVESAIRPLDTEQANPVRRTVNNLLQKAQPPKTNVTDDKKQALKEDNTILFLPADKGRTSQFSAMSLPKIVQNGGKFKFQNAISLNG